MKSSSLSIVLPIFNEKKSLLHVLDAWEKFLQDEGIQHQFVLCEDGSTDGTKELILSIESIYPIKNLSSQERRGYGGGVLAGIRGADYDYIMCIDSDGQCMPDSFNDLWRMRGENIVVIGERHPRKDPFIRKIYSGLFLILFKLLFGSQVKDPSCPYVIATKKTFVDLIPFLSYMREGFWWGFIGASHLNGMQIREHKIKHYERYDGSTVVYKPSKMPAIILRNIKGLIKLRFSKK